jgi:hypothetical protein
MFVETSPHSRHGLRPVFPKKVYDVYKTEECIICLASSNEKNILYPANDLFFEWLCSGAMAGGNANRKAMDKMVVDG